MPLTKHAEYDDWFHKPFQMDDWAKQVIANAHRHFRQSALLSAYEIPISAEIEWKYSTIFFYY